MGQDPKINQTPSGTKVANVSIGISEGKGDEKKTEWVNCVLWKYAAEEVEGAQKGDVLVIQDGRLRTRKYTDKNGVEKYATEVHAFSAVHKPWHRKGDADRPASGASSDPFDEIPF